MKGRIPIVALVACLLMTVPTATADSHRGTSTVIEEFAGGIDNATVRFSGQLWNDSLEVELPKGATVLEAGLTLEGIEGFPLPSVLTDFNNTAVGKSLWAKWKEGRGIYTPNVDPYNSNWNAPTKADYTAVAKLDGGSWMTETTDTGNPPFSYPIQLYHFTPDVTQVLEVTVTWSGMGYCSMNKTNYNHVEMWLFDHVGSDWEQVANRSWDEDAAAWVNYTFDVPSKYYSLNGSVAVAMVGIHSQWAGPMIPAFDIGRIHSDYIGLLANSTGTSEYPSDVELKLGAHPVTIPGGELVGELRLGDEHDLKTALQAAILDAVVEPGNMTVAFNLSLGESSAGLLKVKDLYIEYELPVNHAPEWQGPSGVNVPEDSPYTEVLDLDASFLDDHNMGALAFEVVDAGGPNVSARVKDPQGKNATLEVQPVPDFFGEQSVTVRATDRFGLHVDATVAVTVEQRPDHPSLDMPAELEALENVPFEYTVNVTDPDLPDDALTFMDDSDAFDIDPSTGTINWTPTSDQIGTHRVLVTVTDKFGLRDQRFVNIVVVNTNDAPRITSPLTHTAKQDEATSYIARADDPDVPFGDALTFSAFSESLEVSIDPVSGVLAFTPRNANVPSFIITLRVQDKLGATAEAELVVTVRNVNDPPVFASVDTLTYDQGDVVSYRLDADDPDLGLDLPVKEFLTFSAQGLVALRPDDHGWVNFTPDQSMVGEHSVVYTVRDSGGLTDVITIRWVIRDVNEAPVFAPYPPARVDAAEDMLLNLEFTYYDPEGDACTFSDGTDLFDIDPANGTVAFTPLQEHVGTHTVTITVTDARGLLTSFTFELVVANVNDAPVVTVVSPAPTDRFKEGSNVLFTAEAEDEDGDELTYEWREGDKVLGTEASFIRKGFAPGSHTVTLTVSDGLKQTETTVTFEVTAGDGLDGSSFWLGVLLVVVLAAVAAAFLVMRSRRADRGAPEAARVGETDERQGAEGEEGPEQPRA